MKREISLVTKRVCIGTLMGMLALLPAGGALADEPSESGALDAAAVFEQLKGFEGTWKGEAKGEGSDESAETPGAVHEFRVASAGTVVMETMNQGTPHEMINMYHLDGEDLRLTHYCAGNNQPHMKLDREASHAGKLIFAYVGGTNLDPAVDSHIHGVEITIEDSDHILSSWHGYDKGKHVGTMNFKLAR